MNIQKLENTRDGLKSIAQRFTAPSPLFFQKIMKLCGGIVTIAGAVLLLPVTFTITLPAIVTSICTTALISATTGAGIAKLAVDWNEVEKQKDE
jgi:hypothetical protein